MEPLHGDARDELKRVDHSIYVTLKYTRTTDVIRNTIKRLIDAYKLAINDAMIHAKNRKIITVIPNSALEKNQILKQIFKKDIIPYLELFSLLKKIITLDYKKKEEYRKHVTLVCLDGGNTINVDVPILTEFYFKTREFVDMINKWIQET